MSSFLLVAIFEEDLHRGHTVAARLTTFADLEQGV